MRKMLAALTVAAIAAGALAVGSSATPDGAAALDDLVAQHAGVHGSMAGPRTLADSLPNTKHATTGESASTAVVRAHVSGSI